MNTPLSPQLLKEAKTGGLYSVFAYLTFRVKRNKVQK